MLDLMLLLFGAVTLYLFIHKLVYKRRMRRQLGRKVEDRELTSITSWMEAPSDERASGSKPRRFESQPSPSKIARTSTSPASASCFQSARAAEGDD